MDPSALKQAVAPNTEALTSETSGNGTSDGLTVQTQSCRWTSGTSCPWAQIPLCKL